MSNSPGELALKRRDFLTNSLLSGMLLTLSGPILSAVTNNKPLYIKNDHNDFLKLLNKSKGSFEFLTMAGIDPTIEFIHNSTGGDVGSVYPGIAFFNDKYESAIIDTPLFPHSIEQNPNNLNRVMLIPRRSQTCVEFDVIQNKVVSELTLKDRKFYGHGCYIPDTDYFYASTLLRGSEDASMALFDVKSGKMIKEIFVEGGAGSHQCALSLDKKHIIITFAQGTKTHKPSIVWLDIKTGEVVNRIFGMRSHAKHFSELSDGYVIFTGGTDDIKIQTVIGSIDPDKKVDNFTVEKEQLPFFGAQSVSIVGQESKSFSFMANVISNSIYVINYKTGKLIKRIEISNPRGLTLSNDGKYLLVTSISNPNNTDARVSIIDIDKLEIINQFKIDHALAYSSHSARFKIS